MFDKLIDLFVSLWTHFQPILFINQYDEGVMLRGGKYLKNLKSGRVYFRIPFVDDFHTDTVTTDTMRTEDISITTLDGKNLTIGIEFDLRIVDIYKALILTHSWKSNLKDIATGVLSDTLEDYNWDDLRKKTTKNAVEKKLQKRAEEIGIEVANLNFTNKVLSTAYKLFSTTKDTLI